MTKITIIIVPSLKTYLLETKYIITNLIIILYISHKKKFYFKFFVNKLNYNKNPNFYTFLLFKILNNKNPIINTEYTIDNGTPTASLINLVSLHLYK